MDYLEIVLQGYFNENNREFLSKYFLREYKKAKKEFFEADEFFEGCLRVIERWEKDLQSKVFERKKQLYQMINVAKNGTMKLADLKGKTIEQARQEKIEYCEQELKDVRPDGIGNITYYVNLFQLTNGRIRESLPYNELGIIKESISNAYQRVKSQNETASRQQSTKEDLSENTEPNNLTASTIEDWLFEFKERGVLTEHNYSNLVYGLTHYFENGVFPKLKQTIKVGRVNKKLLGWHLNRIFFAEGKGVEIDLLNFAKENISTFKDVEFDEKDIKNSNLYKYFTTKTT